MRHTARHGSTLPALPAFLAAVAAALPLLAAAASGYPEKPGAKDYALISRFQGSILANAGTVNFDHVDIPLAGGQTLPVEGKVYSYYYVSPANRSDLEVFRSYQQALAAARFKPLHVCDVPAKCEQEGLGKHAADWSGTSKTFSGGYNAMTRLGQNGNYPPRYLAAKLERPEGDVYAVLTVQPPSSTQKDAGVGAPYFLQVIEAGTMQTGSVTVNADAIVKGLAVEGKVALYGVYFDTGKAELKPESKAQLDEMARMLTHSRQLKVAIVGHTDNQGNMDGNLALSQKRAEAVVSALSANYKIEPKRLMARGVASLSPVASNSSEPGRARNRRVELVEQ